MGRSRYSRDESPKLGLIGDSKRYTPLRDDLWESPAFKRVACGGKVLYVLLHVMRLYFRESEYDRVRPSRGIAVFYDPDLGIDKNTFYRAVQTLEGMGFIRRRPDWESGRPGEPNRYEWLGDWRAYDPMNDPGYAKKENARSRAKARATRDRKRRSDFLNGVMKNSGESSLKNSGESVVKNSPCMVKNSGESAHLSGTSHGEKFRGYIDSPYTPKMTGSSSRPPSIRESNASRLRERLAQRRKES